MKILTSYPISDNSYTFNQAASKTSESLFGNILQSKINEISQSQDEPKSAEKVSYPGKNSNIELRPFYIEHPLKVINFEEDLKAAQKDFSEIFNTLLNKKNIDTTNEIRITSDSFGKVRLISDHPQKNEIEKIFEENPDLANMYRKMSAGKSMYAALQESLKFQEMYRQNPEAAVQRYAYLFNDNRQQEVVFSLRNGESDLNVTEKIFS